MDTAADRPTPLPTEPAAPAGNRLDILDALRGFALFGVLLANILYWCGFVLMTEAQRVDVFGAEAMAWQHRLHLLLVDGKFYTLFSLLFGAGFAMQLARLSQRGHDGLRIYRRRVLVLLAIGLAHSWLVWDGDILVLYALLGLLLPLFHRWRDAWLLLAAGLLVFVVPFVGKALFAALGWAPHQALFAAGIAIGGAFGIEQTPEYVLTWVQREDWYAHVAWLASGPPFSWGLRLESWRLPKVLGIMLLGLWAGRRLAAGTLLGDRRLLWTVLLAGLAIGLPASLVYASTPGHHQDSWASQVGTVPLALAYASAFVLAWPWARRWLGVLAAPGRMALTNYLAQSVVCSIAFLGVGLGWIGRVSFAEAYAFAVALFVVQAVVSRWWLARHAQGPMEALWRRWTYGN
ncbi:MAG: DUF418 domain-containing protein [Pseudomonadota bacterium]|nr:DUF418 domain-containing protein [Pseudomonadota bacterium]